MDAEHRFAPGDVVTPGQQFTVRWLTLFGVSDQKMNLGELYVVVNEEYGLVMCIVDGRLWASAREYLTKVQW